MNLYPKLILDALSKVRYPGTSQDLVSSGMVEDNIRIEGNKVSFSLIFEKQNDPFIKSVVKAAETAILTYVGEEVDIKGNIKVVVRPAAPVKEEEALLPGVKNVVVIASGKGGVGKSTITTNLAVALAAEGYRVGLLDADIFGPSIPKMLDMEEARPVMENILGRDRIIPEEKYGLKVLSIGFFVQKENAIVWRGPMASNALKQLIGDTYWGELDYFLIDLPPGTSDIHLTLVQNLKLSGAIVVTTPQQVALTDARKAVDMFQNEKINVPILGLVENMSWFTPAELPQNRYYLFGKDGGAELAKERGVPLLGQIPLVQSVCESGDAGRPAALNADTVMGQAFRQLAAAVQERLEKR